MTAPTPHHVLLITGGKGQHIAENTKFIESALTRAGMTVATSDEPASLNSLAGDEFSAVAAPPQPFLTAWWCGAAQPLAFTRAVGAGRIVYLANGHDTGAVSHPTFQQLLVRSVRYAAGDDWSARTAKVAAIGYGGAFN